MAKRCHHEKFLHDALIVPDLAAVEASFDRSRLMAQSGTTLQQALDASLSIQATNSLKKMLAAPAQRIGHKIHAPLFIRGGCNVASVRIMPKHEFNVRNVVLNYI